jgi:hypothetical protein
VLIFAVVLGLALAACGSTADDPGARGTTSPTPSVSSTPTQGGSTPTTKPPTSVASSRPSVKAKPSPGATASPSSVVLDLKCARRGVDVQGITFQTKPGGPAGFNTQYSDGSSSVDGKSSYSSGFGGGFADAQGVWRATWTVPDNAPLGVATVKTVTQDGALEVKFTVVGKTGTCPA